MFFMCLVISLESCLYVSRRNGLWACGIKGSLPCVVQAHKCFSTVANSTRDSYKAHTDISRCSCQCIFVANSQKVPVYLVLAFLWLMNLNYTGILLSRNGASIESKSLLSRSEYYWGGASFFSLQHVPTTE